MFQTEDASSFNRILVSDDILATSLYRMCLLENLAPIFDSEP